MALANKNELRRRTGGMTRTIALRAVLLSVFWYALAGGSAGAWAFGLVVVVLALAISLGRNTMLELFGNACLLVGAAFFLAGTAGRLRFPDLHTRLHVLAKVDNVALGFTVLDLFWTCCRARKAPLKRSAWCWSGRCRWRPARWSAS
jgi:multisubunit Na+/H+ antiporter MnhG subunit